MTNQVFIFAPTLSVVRAEDLSRAVGYTVAINGNEAAALLCRRVCFADNVGPLRSGPSLGSGAVARSRYGNEKNALPGI